MALCHCSPRTMPQNNQFSQGGGTALPQGFEMARSEVASLVLAIRSRPSAEGHLLPLPAVVFGNPTQEVLWEGEL